MSNEKCSTPSTPSNGNAHPAATPPRHAPRDLVAERRALRRTGAHDLSAKGIRERSLGDLLTQGAAGYDSEDGSLAVLTLRALHDDLLVLASVLEHGDCSAEHVERLANKCLVAAELAERMRDADEVQS